MSLEIKLGVGGGSISRGQAVAKPVLIAILLRPKFSVTRTFSGRPRIQFLHVTALAVVHYVEAALLTPRGGCDQGQAILGDKPIEIIEFYCATFSHNEY